MIVMVLVAGKVSIFQHQNGHWNPLGKSIVGLTPYEHFGTTVAMNASGNIIAVGAIHSKINGDNSGQVRVFEFRDQEWVPLGQPLNGLNAYDEFGYQICLSNDGKTIAVGAPHNELLGDVRSSVTVYTLQHNTWEILGKPILGTIQHPYIEGHPITHKAQIGTSLDLSKDGKSIIIGTNSGEGDVSVYELHHNVWKRKGNPVTYYYLSYKMPSNTVATNEDGSVIAIGYSRTQISRYSEDTKRGNELLNGHVQVFTLNANEVWEPLGNTIYGMDLDHFAYHIKLNKSGNRIAVTSNGPDPDDGPKDYNFVSVFELINDQWKLYGERIQLDHAYLHVPNSISINDDASTIIIGNSNMDEDHNTFGEVKIFKHKS